LAFGVLALSIAAALSFGCTGQTFRPQRIEAETLPTATPARSEEAVITIAAVGDIMLGSPFPNNTRMPPNDGAVSFGQAAVGAARLAAGEGVCA